ncbi:MAG: aspartate aminotransferase family protein [Conexivisphaerales archaeon]
MTAYKGSGMYLFDTDNRRYLDFMAGYGVAILGHGHPRIVKSISDQARKLITAHGSLYSEAREKFIEAFIKIVPEHLGHMYLCNSGAEAVEASLKFARKVTGRKGFITFSGSYHGKTFGALSVTSNERYRAPFEPLLGPVYFGDYGSIESLGKLPFDQAAAAIIEPVQGESGVKIPSKEFMNELEERCKRAGCLLIVDEIQSGLGRTGKIWAHQHFDIVPDIMTVAKGLGGGVPMGATLVNDEIANHIQPGDHSTTFGGNPLACAAGAVVADILYKTDLVQRAANTGELLRKRLQSFSAYRIFKEYRSIGLMAAIELRIRFNPVLLEAVKNGLLTLYSGRNTIRMLPPLIVNEQNVETAMTILHRSFEFVERSKVEE